MVRPLRYTIPGVPLHVYQRGNNRTACFKSEEDYFFYLRKLEKAAAKYAVALHNFVLMTNHVHLLVTPETASGVSSMMQSLGASYVLFFNRKYERTGTLWEGRFKATLIDCECYFFTLSRYIELNPVRAGMVSNPALYPWSSFMANAFGAEMPMLTPHPLYLQLGRGYGECRSRYHALFADAMSETELKEVRGALAKSDVLGDSVFKKRMAARLGIEQPRYKNGGDRRSATFKKRRKHLRPH